jgi:two-component system chemotaxis response regulator CheB
VIRVLVAEDSATVRELLVAILESDPEIQVVGEAKNGEEAVTLAKQLRPDLITMDIHMPVMDGFAATKEIMVMSPTPILIVSASSSVRDVEMSLNALRAGALMIVAKPNDPRAPNFEAQQEQLLGMVRAMADVKVVRRWAQGALSPRPTGANAIHTPVVAIAASTGGPAALQQLLSELPPDFPASVLIVQHIAQGFTSGLAEWLGASSPLRVKVAENGETLAPRTVFLAPDELHMGLVAGGRIAVSDAPPVDGFRPSASLLFESVARHAGSSLIAVVLTGMGLDGAGGLSAVREAGGEVIAQDEATSVVYGMPRAAVETGLVDRVLPLASIAVQLTASVRRILGPRIHQEGESA